MIEDTLEVGPFTPQEIEEVCEKLKSQGAVFEVLKDEDAEKSEMKNDYVNVVMKAEYRLEPYLGQVFYLRLKRLDFDRNHLLFQEYGMATTHDENPKELEADISDVIEDAKEQRSLQRLAARALVILAFSAFLYGMSKLIQELIRDFKG